MTKELKEMIAPRWCDEKNGVYIPLIGKVLEAKNLTSKPMNWYNFMALASVQRKQVATRKELLQLYLQKDEINVILKEHDGDLLEGLFGSSSKCDIHSAWIVNFGSGRCYSTFKNDLCLVRTVVEL